MAQAKLHLLIIDPQNDFCDLPEAYCPEQPGGDRAAPALPIPGAHADLQRVATLIEEGGSGLTDISVTLDSHQRLDIAHPPFWQRGDGSDVAAFTPISATEVRAGAFVPRWPGALPRVLAYLDALESQGRYAHRVWPIHCEIGSWGHDVHPDVRQAYNRWEERTRVSVNKVTKGENPWTEHYSAIQAEVPDDSDASTQLNRAFVAALARADRLFIGGEAGSHCVRATTLHLLENLDQAQRRKLVLVLDCMSPVAGFGREYQRFLADAQAEGVALTTSREVLAELRANGRDRP